MTLSADELPSDVVRALRSVRLVVFDFDGVFTDNFVYVATDGTETVRCTRADGIGLKALERAGVKPMILSSELNPVVKVRAQKLRVRCECTDEPKELMLAHLVAEVGCTLAEVAYVGNDVNDAACLRQVGVPIVVADAHPDVLPLAKLRTTIHGGHGAVREVCDLIVRLRETA